MAQDRSADARHETETADTSRDELLRRRKNARRTALVLGAIALTIFVTFLMTGVIGRG